jgi:hypothetical protein
MKILLRVLGFELKAGKKSFQKKIRCSLRCINYIISHKLFLLSIIEYEINRLTFLVDDSTFSVYFLIYYEFIMKGQRKLFRHTCCIISIASFPFKIRTQDIPSRANSSCFIQFSRYDYNQK